MDVGRKLLGGGDDVTGCPDQTPTEVARLVIGRMSAAERAHITGLLANGNAWAQLDNPANVAWAFAGGSDCKNTSAQGKADRLVWDAYVTKYGDLGGYAGGGATYPLPGGPGGGHPIIPDPGPVIRPDATWMPDPGPALETSLADKLKQMLKDAAAAAAGSVLPGAYDALPPAQQAQVDEYAARQYAAELERRTGGALTANMPLLIGGGLALAFVASQLMGKKR